jgi:hypothetical protein
MDLYSSVNQEIYGHVAGGGGEGGVSSILSVTCNRGTYPNVFIGYT